ncbi:unnamed protein product [Symbiodinium natans]|uniref:Uncharacterized protein n=1 Tax=Symbiodinium natans TaxID=878477 RepID=A0A812PBD5_9DINO|nr:unnamed protein product [Symbiodinium natans]
MARRSAALAVASAAALALSGGLAFVVPKSEQANSVSLRASVPRAQASAAPSAAWSAGATAVAAAALAAGVDGLISCGYRASATKPEQTAIICCEAWANGL